MFIKLYLVALIAFFAIDITWIGFIAKNFYQKQIGYLLAPQVNWSAALAFYLLFIGALVFFVIAPAVEAKSLTQAILWGAFFGLVTYATYDLTNLATTKDWPLLVTLVDMAWGAFLASAISTVTYLVSTRFFV